MKSIVKGRVRFGLIVVLGLAAGVALIALMARPDGAAPASATHGVPLLPHATILIWDVNAAAPFFGNDPNMTVADPAGVTAQVATAANPLTIVTVFENTFCSGLPCGVTYWNPAQVGAGANVFRCYGYSGGLMTGVDVNRSGPVMPAPADTPLPAGSRDGVPVAIAAYGVGDTWLAKSGGFSTVSAPGRPLTVQFPGTDNFRSWGAGNLSSVAVDQATGLIWFTDQSGFIGLFDPATNGVTRWSVLPRPRDVAVDSAGNAYATVEPVAVAGGDIVQIDPSAALGSQVTRWAIPGGGLDPSGASFSDNPDGITIDDEGRIWFAESVSDEIGRLDPAINEFAEYTKVQPVTGANTINEPQNVGSSGSGGLLQTFFSEGAGSAVGIVTQVEAAGTTQELITIVAPTTPATIPTTDTLTPSDHIHLASQKTIPPTVTDVEGLDGVPGSGDTVTQTGEVIPGILRFPMPAGSTRATGMTDVAAANTVFGSLIGSEEMFGVTSGAIIAPPEEEEEGRMTGGGSVFQGSRVTHGFTLQCDVSRGPNRLQVNWGKGNKFHLENLDSATCSDDPNIDPQPPPADFDTYVGAGTGRYKGVSGATAEWTFTDAGQPGTNDFAEIEITDADGNVVLTVSGNLNKGNHQAHKGKPTDDVDGDSLGLGSPPWFRDEIELFVGTDPLSACANDNIADNEAADSTPPDLNNDQAVNIVDRARMVSQLLSGIYNQRFDLNGDGALNIQDRAIEVLYVGQICDGGAASALGLGSEWVFTGSGFEPAFATIDNSDLTTELCSLP